MLKVVDTSAVGTSVKVKAEKKRRSREKRVSGHVDVTKVKKERDLPARTRISRLRKRGSRNTESSNESDEDGNFGEHVEVVVEVVVVVVGVDV